MIVEGRRLLCFVVVVSCISGDEYFSRKEFYKPEATFRRSNDLITTRNTKLIENEPNSSKKSNKPSPYWLESKLIRSPTRTVDNMVLENNVIESKPLMLRRNYSSNAQEQLLLKPEKANVIDWFLGAVGIQKPDPIASTGTGNSPKDCPSCKCGQTFAHVRIVGGIETMVNEYPWMIALLYNNRFYCGATLINNKYCLTAAHCVNGFNKDKITAVFLDHDRSDASETKTITRKLKNIYRHRGYGSGSNYNNDVAILQLEQEVSLTGRLKPVCLPPTGRSFTGFTGIVTGWGATKEHGQISNKLREVKVPILSNIDCRKTGYSRRITENMMCAGYPDGQKDSCQGDSGGPLHVKNGTVHQIVGIVSWGEGCAQPNYPGVYTRVNRYISWIKSNTRDACYCN